MEAAASQALNGTDSGVVVTDCRKKQERNTAWLLVLCHRYYLHSLFQGNITFCLTAFWVKRMQRCQEILKIPNMNRVEIFNLHKGYMAFSNSGTPYRKHISSSFLLSFYLE